MEEVEEGASSRFHQTRCHRAEDERPCGRKVYQQKKAALPRSTPARTSAALTHCASPAPCRRRTVLPAPAVMAARSAGSGTAGGSIWLMIRIQVDCRGCERHARSSAASVRAASGSRVAARSRMATRGLWTPLVSRLAPCVPLPPCHLARMLPSVRGGRKRRSGRTNGTAWIERGGNRNRYT